MSDKSLDEVVWIPVQNRFNWNMTERWQICVKWDVRNINLANNTFSDCTAKRNIKMNQIKDQNKTEAIFQTIDSKSDQKLTSPVDIWNWIRTFRVTKCIYVISFYSILVLLRHEPSQEDSKTHTAPYCQMHSMHTVSRLCSTISTQLTLVRLQFCSRMLPAYLWGSSEDNSLREMTYFKVLFFQAIVL